MPANRVRSLLQRIERCNSDAIAATGDIDPNRIAALISASLDPPETRQTVLLGLSEFVGRCLAGVVPDL